MIPNMRTAVGFVAGAAVVAALHLLVPDLKPCVVNMEAPPAAIGMQQQFPDYGLEITGDQVDADSSDIHISCILPPKKHKGHHPKASK